MATIYRDDPAFARLDERDQGYRYDLEADIRWDLLGAPGALAPAGFMRLLGVDVDGIRACGAWELFEWLYGLLVCQQFIDLEHEVLIWLKGNDALVPTRSLEWLRDEEIKHIKTFNRFKQHLLGAAPERAEHAARARALVQGLHVPSHLVPLEGEDERGRHYLRWLAILVFEEYTVFLHEALRAAGEPVQPTWLDVHRCHAQEELLHVATDAQYVRALDLGHEGRAERSQRSVAWLMGRYTLIFRMPVKMLLELRPELRGRIAERPPAGFMDALLTSPSFAESRACAPYLQVLAARRRA